MKTTSKILIIFQALLSAFLMGLMIHIVSHGLNSFSEYFAAVSYMVCFLCLIAYLLFGAKKPGAIYLKITLCIIGFIQFANLVSFFSSSDLSEKSIVVIILCPIAYLLMMAIYLTLAFSPDLGKKVSFTIAGIAFVLSMIIFVAAMLKGVGTIIDPNADIASTLRNARSYCNVSLSVSVIVCMALKYIDKASRGSN
ncbi:MAG: hypothetical protein MJ236_01105 [Clostridia bacterium]|nr:hypothetical protein [Clostridia bacterium]